jgi:putative spermidine/putrescine transport system permease protein
VLFCGGIGLTVCQSLGILTPLPHPGELFSAYTSLFSNRFFYASFGFSIWVAGASALAAVGTGTLLATWIWKLPPRLQDAAVITKIPLILPHISVAFVVLVFWSQSGVVASLAHAMGLIQSPQDFPNILYSGFGLGMILAYAFKGTPFAMLLVLTMLYRFDRRQIQTAAMLGASRTRIFLRVVLPRVLPAVHTAFIILFLYSFGAYDIPALLSESRPGMLSINVFNLYFKKSLTERPEAMAILTIMFAFALLFILMYSKAVSGLESGERKV